MRKLRIVNILVQPVLVWDDGEELVPGPEMQPFSMKLSDVSELRTALPAELERIEQEQEAAEQDS